MRRAFELIFTGTILLLKSEIIALILVMVIGCLVVCDIAEWVESERQAQRDRYERDY